MRASLSASSRLVLVVVAIALVAVGLADARRGGSGQAPSPSATGAATPGGQPSPMPSSGATASSAGATEDAPPATPELPTPSPSRLGPTASPAASPSPLTRSSPSQSLPPPAPPPTGARSLRELLGLLAVAPENRSGYKRSLFPHWIDADGDGCDTRREVLIDEAINPPTVGQGCFLIGGEWYSLYDGVETTDPRTFDVDHVVALAEAWDSGASAWSTDRRTSFANDLGVDWALIAVSAVSNRSKSDKDPSEWLPPLAGVRCEYVAMWIAVKVRWSLTVDPAERAALESDLAGCTQRIAIPLAP